jgi:hypothetical protein
MFHGPLLISFLFFDSLILPLPTSSSLKMLFPQPLYFSPFPTTQIHFRFHRLFFFALCPDLLDAVLLKAAALLQLAISSRSYHNANFKDCKMLAAGVETLSIL